MYYKYEVPSIQKTIAVFGVILFFGVHLALKSSALAWKITLISIAIAWLYDYIATREANKQESKEQIFYTYIKQKQKEGKITSQQAWDYLHNKQDEEQIRKTLDAIV